MLNKIFYFAWQIPCNGISGRAKQFIAHASLQATERNHILTPKNLYKRKILQELHIST
jgi:hypothetical protein